MQLFSIGIGLKIFTRTNESVYGVWNTTAGRDSLPSTVGNGVGEYWPRETPSNAIDNNITSIYTNHGVCNFTLYGTSCGENTGFYATLSTGPIILNAFYFITLPFSSNRDPLTITIEGSNQNSSLLTFGSSWTLIYNGSTGLTINPGRSAKGTTQILQNLPAAFASYRVLITSKRGIDTSTSYAEFVIIYN